MFMRRLLVSVIVVLLAVDAISLYLLYPRFKSTTQPQGKIAQLTHDFTTTLTKYNSAPEAEKAVVLAELVNVATKRRDAILATLSEDPKAFLSAALPKKVRDEVPGELKDKGLIEEQKTVSGEITTIIKENIEARQTAYEYFIGDREAKFSEKKRLHLTEVPRQQILSGTAIAASGFEIANNFVAFAEPNELTAGLMILDVPPPPAIKEARIAIILFNFQNDRSEPESQESMLQKTFTDRSSAANFYKENSLQQLNMTGDVYGYYTVPYNREEGACNNFEWAEAAEAEAEKNGVDLSNYPYRFYVFPGDTACYSSAWATLYSSPARAWFAGSTNSYIVAHEFGHNLGLLHANFLDCGNKSIGDFANYLSDCQNREYDDYTDIMGRGQLLHFNAPHKMAAGWLSNDQIATVSATGTHTVTYNENQSVGNKVIHIPLSGYRGNYYLGYRQPVGFDSTLAPGVTNGIQLHYSDYPIQTQILNVNPGNPTSDYWNSLVDQQSFTDAQNGITITQLSHTATEATVLVAFDDTVCRPAVPTMVASPMSQTGDSNLTRTYEVTVTNNDPVACSGDNYALYGYGPNDGWHVIFSETNFTLAPGAAKTVSVTVTPATWLAIGSYSVYLSLSSAVNYASLQLTYEVPGQLSRVEVEPKAITVDIDSEPVQFSALAYDEKGRGMWKDVTNEWGMSSTNSVGTIIPNHNLAQFTPVSPGKGDLFVIARYQEQQVISSIPVEVTSGGGELDRVELQPQTSIDFAVGDTINFSALAYNTANQPLWSGVNYSWGISSVNSIAQLVNGYVSNTVGLVGRNPGEGDFYVRAEYNGKQAIKSLPVHVRPAILSSSAPSPIFTKTDFMNAIKQYLQPDDRFSIFEDNRINMLDAVFIMRWLSP